MEDKDDWVFVASPLSQVECLDEDDDRHDSVQEQKEEEEEEDYYDDNLYEFAQAQHDDDEEEEDAEHEDVALHDQALDQTGQHDESIVRVMDRLAANPCKESWKEYVSSVVGPASARRELHELKMIAFHGYGPDPEPFLEDADSFNPLFHELWIPWAIRTQYCHDEDYGLQVYDGGDGLQLRMVAAEYYMCSAVPTRPVLEYMLDRTPSMRFAHVCTTGSSYWACLLQRLGGKVRIVTEHAALVHHAPCGLPALCTIGEEAFFKQNMASGRALFFCQQTDDFVHGEDINDDDGGVIHPCIEERCLFCFPGGLVFSVEMRGKASKGFSMARWMEEHSAEGWRVEREVELPCWPGPPYALLCCVRSEQEAGEHP